MTASSGRQVVRALAVVAALGGFFGTGPGREARAEEPFEIKAPTTDHDGALGTEGVATIDRALVALKAERGVEMAVVVIKTTDGVPIEDWAQSTFMLKTLGTRGNDDGVLLVLAMGDRRNRLHLGYGIEPWVTDGEAAGILEGAKPKLRDGDVAGAVLSVIEGVRLQTAGYAPGAPVQEPSVPLGARFPGMWIVAILAALTLGIGGTLLVRRLGPTKKKAKAKTRGTKQKKSKARDERAALDAALAGKKQAPNLAVYRAASWGLWVGGPVLMGLVYGSGGFGFAYGILTLAWMFIGWLWVKRPAGIFGAFFGACAIYFLVDVLAGPVTPGQIVEASAIPWGICFVLWFMSFIPAGSGASSGSTYGGTSYGGSSYGGSSSSSSSGSSYSGSSSSSGSSDWGGGGGSSGGGGASSSW